MIENCITGASGFIGQYLVKKLTGGTVRIEHGQMAYMDCQNLFFLSAYGNMSSHSNNSEMIHANVEDLIWWIKSDLVKGWLCYMSSSSVTLPVQTPYSRTKRAAEEILQALPELKSCIVRPYSVTGVGEQKEHLIPTLIRSCMEGEEMPFDPHPVHDFIDVEDVVNCLIKLSELKHIGIVELGTGNLYSNQKVLEIVQDRCGKKANIRETKTLRLYDNTEWYCRNSWFRIRYKTFSDTIDEMVEDYKLTH